MQIILALAIVLTSGQQLFWNHKTVTGGKEQAHHIIAPKPVHKTVEPIILWACTYDSGGTVIECVEAGSYLPGLPENEE